MLMLLKVKYQKNLSLADRLLKSTFTEEEIKAVKESMLKKSARGNDKKH